MYICFYLTNNDMLLIVIFDKNIQFEKLKEKFFVLFEKGRMKDLGMLMTGIYVVNRSMTCDPT